MTTLEKTINPELIKKIQEHFFITNLEKKIDKIHKKIKDQNMFIKVYENLININKLLDRLIQDPTNTTLKSRLICLINQFNWDKFIKSEKLRNNKYNIIDKELILSLQQLQTGDIIGFSDIPDSCIKALDLSLISENRSKKTNISRPISRGKGKGRDRGIGIGTGRGRGSVRITSGVISKKKSNKFTRKSYAKIKKTNTI